MPQLICNNCRQQTIQAYNFKTTCKRSDDALKLFLATGNLIKPARNPVEVSTIVSYFDIQIVFLSSSKIRKPGQQQKDIEFLHKINQRNF